jgi:general secretion pathway protein D
MLQGLMSNASLVSSAPSGSLTASGGLSSGNTSGGSANTSNSNTSTSSGSSSGSSSSSASGSNNKGSFGVSIIADESQNALVVKADPALMREIESAIKQLDVRRTQVLIQAAIVEVSGGNLDQLGVQWALGNASTGVGMINFNNVGTSVANLYAAVASNNPSLASGLSGALIGIGASKTSSDGQTSFYGAILQALKTTSQANLLSVPSIMTLDNEEANILVGQNVPFITGSSTTSSGGTSNPFTTIERQDIGISLKVIPHVGDGGSVRLEVAQEVSSLVPATSSIKSADLITNKRLIKTTILADDQQTIALGGLIQDDSTQSLSQVPGLGRLPLIGGLFRSKSNEQTKRNLLVFLQPTILRGNEGVRELTQSRYNQIRTLQLRLDQKGDFSRLPTELAEVYSPVLPDAPTPKAKQ